MARAAADAEDEQAPTTCPHGEERRGEMFDGVRVEQTGNLRRLLEILASEAAAHSAVILRSRRHSRTSVRATSMAFASRKALLSPRSRSMRSIGTSTNVRVTLSAFTRTSA